MSRVEKLSNAIAISITSNLKLSSENEKIIAYGAFAFIQSTLSIVLIIIFASLFKILAAALIISLVGNLLRKYSGGAHATSPGRCAAIGTFTSVGLALSSKVIRDYINVLMIIFLGFLCCIYCYYIILKMAPVDSPSKPITKLKRR